MGGRGDYLYFRGNTYIKHFMRNNLLLIRYKGIGQGRPRDKANGDFAAPHINRNNLDLDYLTFTTEKLDQACRRRIFS